MLLKSSFMFSLQSSFFFFFKQKTAYEVRISDWSSDVCSSDLDGADVAERHGDVGAGAGRHGKALVGIGETELERQRSEEHTSELQSLMRISYDVFCLKKKKQSTLQYRKTNKLYNQRQKYTRKAHHE